MLYTTALCTWFSSQRRLLLWHAFLLCFWMALYLEVLFWSPLFDEILLYIPCYNWMYDDDGVFTMLFSKRVPPARNTHYHDFLTLVSHTINVYISHIYMLYVCFQSLFIEYKNLLYICLVIETGEHFPFRINILVCV